MKLYFGTAALAGTLFFAASMAIAPAALLAEQAPSAAHSAESTDGLRGPESRSGSAGETVITSEPNPNAVDIATKPVPARRAAGSLSELVEAHSGTPAFDAEAKCLAVAVYFESKGEPLSGQLAVAQVMINRTHSGRFPSTVCGVIKQSGQFSFVRRGQIPYVNEGCQAWQTALAIADIARNELWGPQVGGAMFFHAKRVSPHWHATQVASLGNHIFYR